MRLARVIGREVMALEYKVVKIPSEHSLELYENFLNSYALLGWKLVQFNLFTGYVILERLKSSEGMYSG